MSPFRDQRSYFFRKCRSNPASFVVHRADSDSSMFDPSGPKSKPLPVERLSTSPQEVRRSARMKVLVMTAMYPTPANPAFGSFVRTQAESLKRAGVDIEVLVLGGRFRKLIYPQGIFQLRGRLAGSSIDLVHAHYSYVGMI